MRIEPAPSVPSASGPSPAATAAPAPPEEPPGVLLRSQGLRVIPVSPKSGVKFTVFVQICPKIGVCSRHLCSSQILKGSV
jgi:hypothetical protein